MNEPAPVSALSTFIVLAGLGLFGYLFYLAIWRLVSPKRWAPQCEECGRYGDHRRGCSQLPPACPDCGQIAGHHGPLCHYGPRWRRIALVAAWTVLVVLKAVLRHFFL